MKNMMTPEDEASMRLLIDITWENPDGAELREQLFPEGKPEPAVFFERMTEYAKQQYQERNQKA